MIIEPDSLSRHIQLANVEVFHGQDSSAGTPGVVDSTWTYAQADPDAISVIFYGKPPRTWLFARELLEDVMKAQLDETVGLGDVRFQKTFWKDELQIRQHLISPDGEVALYGLATAFEQLVGAVGRMTGGDQLENFREQANGQMLAEVEGLLKENS